MSTHLFTIKKHTITSQHVREYPGATAHEDEEFLELVVTQYNPLSNPCPQDGDLTIIGAHANGFPKVRSHPSSMTARPFYITDVG